MVASRNSINPGFRWSWATARRVVPNGVGRDAYALSLNLGVGPDLYRDHGLGEALGAHTIRNEKLETRAMLRAVRQAPRRGVGRRKQRSRVL